MANMTKQRGKKVTIQDQGNSAIDVHYVNNGDTQDISWASIVNAQPENGESYSKKNCPVPALLAVDCENVSKAHLPLTTSKVVDDSVVLEMTVSSEFTLVGYDDQQDDLIPDDDTLRNYMGTFETETTHTKKKSKILRVKQKRKFPVGRPRRRPRRAQQNDVGEDESDSKPYMIMRKKHIIAVDKGGPHNCEECKRSFSTLGGLKIHMLIHTDGANLTCYICGEGFQTRSCLKEHVTTHKLEGDCFCSECGRWFKNEAALGKHAERHGKESDDRKIIDCSMCGEEYDTEADLAEHVLGHVQHMKVNACLVCGRHLAPMSSMEKHLRTHTGEKMATCPVCFRKFAEAYNLKSHMRIHTGLCICALLYMLSLLIFGLVCTL